MNQKICPSSISVVTAILVVVLLDVSAGLAAGPAEISVWPGVAPGSENIVEEEKVVDRGKGKGYVDRSISDVHRPTLTIHLPKTKSTEYKSTGPRPAIVICPGGGFTRVVVDKEGHDFARFLNQYNVVAFVLKFRTVKTTKHHYGVSAPEADVKRAIRLVRSKAVEWNIDPNKVGVFGFSAGGHVATTAATHFDLGDKSASDPFARESSRPDFLGLAYPLISLHTDVTSDRYRKLLLGDEYTTADVEKYSNELQVNEQTPISFLCHARDDSGVPATNSERFAKACQQAGVECTTFIHDKGGHGFGIRDLGKPIHKWRFAFVEWLKEQNIVSSSL